MAKRYRLRPIAPDDLAALVLLEAASFSDAWTRRQLESSLARPESVGWVAEGARGVIGYLLGRQIVDQGEILSLAVAPRHRRVGVGAALLAQAIAAFAERGVTDVWLEVRISNLGARALYGQAGFAESATRTDYYRRPVEDALVLHRVIA